MIAVGCKERVQSYIDGIVDDSLISVLDVGSKLDIKNNTIYGIFSHLTKKKVLERVGNGLYKRVVNKEVCHGSLCNDKYDVVTLS